MTVSSEINKSGPYAGNGATTVFPYTFRIVDASHIEVIRTVSGVDSTVLPSGYTVSGVGSVSGSVVFLTAPATGVKITIVRNVPFTQQTDLENQGAYYAEVIEQALDLAAMRDQQLSEELSRAVKIPVGEEASTLDTLINDIIRLNDSAGNIDIVAGLSGHVTTVAGISADVTTVAANVADVTNFSDVYLGPKVANPTLRNDGAALQTGDLFFNTVTKQMRVYDGLVWVAASSAVNGTARRQTFTATSGQTVFSVTGGYDAGFADVYRNGVKLVNGVDVIVTSGTSVVLTIGAALGDDVDVVAYGSFSLANTYTIPEANALLLGKQAADATLTALAGITGVPGILVQQNADTFTQRTLTPGVGINIAHGAGSGGEPTISAILATQAQAAAGTDNATLMTPLRLRDGLNATGPAPIYACRAWVNFNGTGVVAIRSAGNVSSLTDVAVGVYNLNFAQAMPNTTYAFAGSTDVGNIVLTQNPGSGKSVSTLQVSTITTNTLVAQDVATIHVAVFC